MIPFISLQRLRKPLLPEWDQTSGTRSESPPTSTPPTPNPFIKVTITTKIKGEEEEDFDTLSPLEKTPRIQKPRQPPNKPVASRKLPDYRHIRRSVDTKVATQSKKSKIRIVQDEKKSFNNPSGLREVQEEASPPPKKELPRLSTDRLKNLVSRDFSKPPPPPATRPDPYRQQLAKPASQTRRPVDIFKQQPLKVNKTMDNMIAMTNYGVLDKPEPVKLQSKPKEEDKKNSYGVPKELKRALPAPKLPPIKPQKVPSPPPTPVPPEPTLQSSSESVTPTPPPSPVEPEMSFNIVTNEFFSEDETVEDSAYCTCEDYLTESEELKSKQTITDDDGTMSSRLKTKVCTNCGGMRTHLSSRVPSSIKEQSFVIEALSPKEEEKDEEIPIEEPPEEVLDKEETIGEVSPEDIIVDLSTPRKVTMTPEVKKVTEPEDILAKLDNIGQFTGIPDPPEREPTPEPELPRAVLAPKKRQKGVYKDGVREQYIKALVAAEVRRLPAEPWMMLGPRISRAWVFSYFENIPRPTDKPQPKKVEPEQPPGKKKKKKKKFKATEHIFGKLDYNSYFPGMKNNLVLEPIELPPRERVPPPVVPYKKPGQLDPLRERPLDRSALAESSIVTKDPLGGFETPVKDFRLRNRSRLSSSHSNAHSHDKYL